MNEVLREQLAQTRSKHILGAAAQVFGEKGFHATGIRDVARAAGVAEGTIYNYFDNKEALLLALFRHMVDRAQQSVDPAELATLDLRGFLRVFVARPVQALQHNQFELFRLVMSEVMVNRSMADAFRQQVLEPMVKGAGPLVHKYAGPYAQHEPESVVYLLSSLVLGILVQAALSEQTLQINWDALATLLEQGLVA